MGWLRLPFTFLERLRGRRTNGERTLIVVRHAAAERQRAGETDRERALTEAGRADAEQLGAWLGDEGVLPDVVLTSPARRAAETTSRLAAASGIRVGARVEERLYQASADDLLALVAAAPDSAGAVLVVAHDPAVSELVAALGGAREGLPAGGAALLRSSARSWREIGGNGARASLVGIWRPRASTARDARGGDVPQPAGGKWVAARADETVAEVAARALEDRFSALATAAAAAADSAIVAGESRGAGAADALRRLRVAGRRAEAALRAYGDLLPRKRTERLRKELRALRRSTRVARDEQVLLERLESRASEPSVATVLSVLRSRRAEPAPSFTATPMPTTARRAGSATTSDSGGRFAERVFDLVQSLRRRAERGVGCERFGEWAARRYAERLARYRAELALAPPSERSIEGLHGLRLAGKRLRYEIELVAAVLPPEVRANVYAALVGMQDLLGAVSDQSAAVARLEQIVAELDASHPRDDLDAMVAAQRMRLDEARAAAVARLMTEKWGQSLFSADGK